MQRSKISITHHAKQRLSERVPEIHPCNYNSFVSSARYNGQSIAELRSSNPLIANYISSNFNWGNSTKVKYYKNCAFVFSGNSHKAHTLVTVVNLSNVA